MTKEALERAYMAGAYAGFMGHVKTLDDARSAFDRWYKEQVEAMSATTVADIANAPIEALKDWTQPIPKAEPFDFGKLPRPGDANYTPRAGTTVGRTVIADRDPQLLPRDPCGNEVKPTDPDYWEALADQEATDAWLAARDADE